LATLTKEPVRAEIVIGGSLTIRTPNVVSFNVRKARGQMSATFSAAIKVPYDEVGSVSGLANANIVIKAGRGTGFASLNTVFTGYIHRCVFSPIRVDASKIMLNISGNDVLHILSGQKINRRLTTTRDGDVPPQRWGIVNSIVKQHSPNRQRFPKKVYTPKKIVVVDWQGNHQIVTPEAFRLQSDPNRKRTFQLRGSLVAEKVLETEEVAEG
jgi:hypothetical protein